MDNYHLARDFKKILDMKLMVRSSFWNSFWKFRQVHVEVVSSFQLVQTRLRQRNSCLFWIQTRVKVMIIIIITIIIICFGHFVLLLIINRILLANGKHPLLSYTTWCDYFLSPHDASETSSKLGNSSFFFLWN